MKQVAPSSEQHNMLKDIVAHAKEYGFLYPSSEIYEGLQAVYDYGPYGATLKRNLQNLWWQSMTGLHENIVGIDAAIFMHPQTWKASGHVNSFHDLMIDNKDSKKRYRADTLIEEHAAALTKKEQLQKAQRLLEAMRRLIEANDLAGLRALIIAEGIKCPVADTAHWTEVKQFSLMFSTKVGAVKEEASTLYLRPETAQGIFVNFLNVQKTARMKIPFGIAQIGKAFRNEIVARQFIFRMREFEQMEMQFFIKPGEETQWFAYWKKLRLQWHLSLGVPKEQLSIHMHDNLAHYAKAAVDIAYAFPFGYKEVEGIHSRTDFDLKNHQALSKKKLQYFDPEVNQNYIPYVIETSLGCDRLFLMILCHAFTKEIARTYLKLHPALAPVKAAIFPLVRKDGLSEKASAIFEHLKYDLTLTYEEMQSIGKRYARQDLIGTPYCITIDYQTLEDDTVTVRERDTMHQKRLKINALKNFLLEKVAFKTILKNLSTA